MKQFDLPTREDLDAIDLNELNETYLKNLPQGYDFFLGAAGAEHYRLLAWFSMQFKKGDLLVDCGTYRGLSALALSYNSKVKVESYDIAHNHLHSDVRERKNIKFVEASVNDKIEDIIKAKLIFLDIDPHDGIQEREFVDKLIAAGYHGYVVCDDVEASTVGTTAWYKSLDLPKQDVSYLGHATGTGILIL